MSKAKQGGEKKPFYVLAVDQATQSGVTFFNDSGSLLLSGVAANVQQRLSVLMTCLLHADNIPLVGVLEDHSCFKQNPYSKVKRSTATILGMGDARGRWRELFDIFGVRYTQISVYEWRAKVLGLPRGVKAEKAKECAIDWASARFDTSRHDVSIDDVAESACIGLMATTLPEVSDLAKMRRKKALCTMSPGGWSFGMEELKNG